MFMLMFTLIVYEFCIKVGVFQSDKHLFIFEVSTANQIAPKTSMPWKHHVDWLDTDNLMIMWSISLNLIERSVAAPFKATQLFTRED